MINIKEEISRSIEAKQNILDDSDLLDKIARAAGIITESYKAGHITLLAGNGGSADRKSVV